MSSSTVFAPLERTRYYTDSDGAAATTKREDEKIEYELDLSDWLRGEVISSVAYVDSGVTRSGTTNTQTKARTTVTGLGEFELTATTGSGRKFQQVVRFYDATGGGARTGDYQL